MKKSKYIIVIAFSCFASCKKLVQVPVPSNQLVTASVFSDDQTAITAQLAVYSLLDQIWISYIANTALSSDELTNYYVDPITTDIYHNNLNALNDGGVNGSWSGLFSIIYQENAIIENVQQSKTLSAAVKQFMTGEALFTRAFCYFQLVNLFGETPLITGTDYTINSISARASVPDVYQQIVKDLTSAQGLLSTTYLDAGDNPNATARVRPTTWAADALLARAYLYMGKYDSAEQQATSVINNPTFHLETDLNKVFKQTSVEAIWQLMPLTGVVYTPEGGKFILTQTPSSQQTGQVSISPQLLNAFEANDARRTNWINSYSEGSTTWYFAYKYKDNYLSAALDEYSMVLRLAELYLIRAEARAQQHESNATDDLNAIRHRAGLPDYTGPTDPGSLLSAILHERQVELFTEEHRWFDLKRTGTVDSVMTTATPQKGGAAWKSYQQLYPLPVLDLQLDPKLLQNPVY